MLRRQPIQLLQYFTTKFALSTQYPQCHYVELRKQLKQPLQQVTTLRQDIASSRPKVACRETTFTTLRLAHNLTHFLHSYCPLSHVSPRSCSISWHSFSPWHNLSKLSSAHVPAKLLYLVVYLAEGLLHA